MHDARDRAMGIVTDRIGEFPGLGIEFRAVGNELACNRVARIGRIDELGDIGGQRQRIAGGHRFDLGAALARDESGRDEIVGAAQSLGCWSHGEVLAA